MARSKKRKPGPFRQKKLAQDAERAAAAAAKAIEESKLNPQEEQQERPAKRAKKKHRQSQGDLEAVYQATPKLDTPNGKDTNEEANLPLTEDNSDPQIAKTHRLFEVSVSSGSRIKTKVTGLLSLVGSINLGEPNSKPVMALVGADGRAAPKAISIIEIAKAELEKDGAKWYQYSTVQPRKKYVARVDEATRAKGGRTIEEWEKSQAPAAANGNGSEIDPAPFSSDQPDDEDEADDGDFEQMAAKNETDTQGAAATGDQTTRFRAVPRIVIYFTRLPCDYLKDLYGYVSDLFNLGEHDLDITWLNMYTVTVANKPTLPVDSFTCVMRRSHVEEYQLLSDTKGRIGQYCLVLLLSDMASPIPKNRLSEV